MRALQNHRSISKIMMAMVLGWIGIQNSSAPLPILCGHLFPVTALTGTYSLTLQPLKFVMALTITAMVQLTKVTQKQPILAMVIMTDMVPGHRISALTLEWVGL